MANCPTSLILSLINGSSSDPIRLSWEAISARWFRGVWISGIVVALGCTLEVWEVAFDVKNWWRHRRKRDTLPDNPGSWRYPLAAVGLFLVVGGIVSETVCEVLVSNAESQLRAHVSNVLSTAETNAAAAQERATANEKEAAEIRESVAPRRLTQTERAKLRRELGRFAGQPVAAFSNSFDVESSVFASELLSALGSAKWNPHSHFGISQTVSSLTLAPSIPVTGVLIHPSPEAASRAAARALCKELRVLGFDCQLPKGGPTYFDPVRGRTERLVIVEVAGRPNGPQGEAKLQAEEANNKPNAKP